MVLIAPGPPWPHLGKNFLMIRLASLAAFVATVALGDVAFAQANEIPGTDVSLAKMDLISAMDRMGAFPNGVSGVAMATTSCNKGSVKVPWEAPMQEDHPFIAFLVVRESNGRFQQISDYSFVKHGFFALTDNFCDTCQEPPFGGGDVLGLGCSDTYGITNNGDNYWLAPPQEIDPWLGEWSRFCSHFDMGEPAVSPPQDCDGVRSLTVPMAQALLPVGHRINIPDSEFLVSGDFYYQGYYVIRGEPELERENNWGSRKFNPSWNGNKWSTPSTSTFANGSVLNRWSGATVTSVKNGNDDGRIYVGVKVTGPVEGLYRYEYAVQNRDNYSGIESFSIPVCPDARVLNAGFSDIDDEAVNDWNIAVNGTSIDFSTTGNPLRWNTIYNFWFDSDAAPVTASADLVQFAGGLGGTGTLSVSTSTPQGLYNVYLGDGCASGDFPLLYAIGSPPQATLGNPNFGLESSGNDPSQPHLVVAASADGSVALGGSCTQWFAGSIGSGAFVFAMTTTDGSGVATYNFAVPSSPSFEGTHANFQGAGFELGGPFAGLANLTNGLRVRLGDAISDCP